MSNDDEQVVEQSPDWAPVLVGVDGSEDSRRALMFALRTATQRDCGLFIIHAVDDAVLAGAWGVVYDPTLLQQAGESVIADAIEAVTEAGFPAEKITSDVVMGNPAGVLTRLSEEASLVVVGRRSVRGLERLFVGSTSVGVAASAMCPVVMVSAATNVAETGSLKRIGVGIEAHPQSELALEWAFKEALQRGALLEIIHAWDQPSGLFSRQLSEDKVAELGRAAVSGIESLVQDFKQRYPEVETEVSVVRGVPVEELVNHSQNLDLLLLGVRSSALGGVGGVIRGVMAHAECPLALVRHEAHGRSPRE